MEQSIAAFLSFDYLKSGRQTPRSPGKSSGSLWSEVFLHGEDEGAFVVGGGWVSGRIGFDVDAESLILRVAVQPAVVGGIIEVLQRFRQRAFAAEFRPVGRGERQEFHALRDGSAHVLAADHVLEEAVPPLAFHAAADGILPDLIVENGLFLRRLRLHRLKQARERLRVLLVPEFRALPETFIVLDDGGKTDEYKIVMVRDDGLFFHDSLLS